MKFTRAVELTDDRRRAIEKKLKLDFSVDDLVRAIDDVRKNKFHCAQDKHSGGEKYVELETIFKKRKTIEGHIAQASQPTNATRNHHRNGTLKQSAPTD